MKVNWNSLFPLLFAVILIQACSEDTNDAVVTYGKLGGQVTNGIGQRLKNARVKISSSSFDAEQQTNEFGRYLFEDLQTGDYKIEVSKESYIGASEMVTVLENVVNGVDFTLEVGEEILNVSDSVIQAGSKSGIYELTLLSNTSWTISSDSDWVSVATSSGSGDGKVKLSWTENSGEADKTALLTVSAGKIVKSVRIVQQPPLKIMQKKWVGGDVLEPDNPTKITLTFNRPISSVQRIEPLFRNCQGVAFSPSLNAEHTELSFTYSCGRLGRTYSFTIEYLDIHNNPQIDNFEVDFYDKKLTIDGRVTGRYLIPNEDKLWIATTAPAMIYKIDLSKFEIEKEFELGAAIPFEHQITVNPYNNHLYISSIGKVDIYNSASGQFIKSIPLPKPDPYSDRFAFDMAFDKSGMGIFSLRETRTSGEQWVKIDSAKDHLISIPAEYGFDEGQFNRVHSVMASTDQKKLKFVAPDGESRGYYESDETHTKFTQLGSFVGGGGYNRAFYSRSDGRAIFDLQDFSIFDGKELLSLGYLGYSNLYLDFVYQTSKPLLYCAVVEEGLFLIFDYQKQEITKKYMSGNWRYIAGTLDGMYLIVQPDDMEYDESSSTFRSIMLQINAEIFL